MAKERTEKRYRVICDSLVRHPYFDCVVEKGEDFNMLPEWRDKLGMPFRTSQEIQANLDNRILEIYHAPVGTPHVVHNRGVREVCDAETGKWATVLDWTPAAAQWGDETKFIDQFTPHETKELPEAKG